MRFRHFGRKDRLPGFLRDALVKLEKETAGYDQYFFHYSTFTILNITFPVGDLMSVTNPGVSTGI